MDRLYLLRHGIAVPHGTPDIPDDERPLTSEGEKGVRKVARGLRLLGLKLDRIVTSPLPRALRTAEIVADVLEMTDLLETADALRAEERCGLDPRLGHRPDRVPADARGAQPEPDRPGRPPDHGRTTARRSAS